MSSSDGEYYLLTLKLIKIDSLFLEMFLRVVLNAPFHTDAQGSGGSKPLPTTSLIHETDLVVSINDLDNLFNSDEDDLTVSTRVSSPATSDVESENASGPKLTEA